MATIRSIAKQAGVSPATVSRVLKNDKTFSVSSTTKEKILDIARDLGYKVKSKNITSEKKEIIAVCMLYSENEELEDRFYQAIRMRAKEEIEKNGYDILELFESGLNSSVCKIKQCKGIILIGYATLWFKKKKFRRAVIDAKIPLVCADFELRDDDIQSDSVINDFKDIVNTAINCFKSNKYDSFGYVGTYGIEVNGTLLEDNRYINFKKILQKEGKYDENNIFLSKQNHRENGYVVGNKIVEKFKLGIIQRLPRAIFVENDPMAIGLLKAFDENMIKVPNDVAVIGCNDDSIASFVTPSLTTVKINNDMIGQIAVQILLSCINSNRKQGIKIIVPSELIIRQSCPYLGREER